MTATGVMYLFVLVVNDEMLTYIYMNNERCTNGFLRRLCMPQVERTVILYSTISLKTKRSYISI